MQMLLQMPICARLSDTHWEAKGIFDTTANYRAIPDAWLPNIQSPDVWINQRLHLVHSVDSTLKISNKF